MVVQLHLADRDCGKCNKGVFDSPFPILTRGMDKLRLNFTYGVTVAHLGWSRRFQVIVHMGRLDGVRNNGGSSNLSWLTITRYQRNGCEMGIFF